MRREIAELKGDERAYELYVEGMAKLRASGYLNALRAIARPVRIERGKDVNAMASEASWSAGFNDCLDSLQHFKELYLGDSIEIKPQVADFGAIDLAVLRGDMTEEEAAIRKQQGEYVRTNAQFLTGNIKLPTKPPSSS